MTCALPHVSLLVSEICTEKITGSNLKTGITGGRGREGGRRGREGGRESEEERLWYNVHVQYASKKCCEFRSVFNEWNGMAS